MKKILIFHPYLAPYRIDLYNRLSKIASLKVLLTGGDAEIATLGFNLEQINKSAEFDYCYYQKGIRIGRHLLSSIYWKVIKEVRPDIILAHELGINTLVAILLRPLFNYKIYTTIDDSPSMALHYGFKREFLRKWIFRHIHGALVVNPQVKNYLENKYKNSDCKYLYFPIIQSDVLLENKINSAQEKAEEYIKRYKLNAKKIILFVGRLETIKAPNRLIEAYESLNDEDSILIIVGKGSLLPHLKQYVKEKGLKDKAILTGALSGKELYAWYYLAHLFVLPSTFEPFGAVVNEALVAGCYTIVSDKVGASSLINETNGDIFKSGDYEQLAHILSNTLNKLPAIKEHQNRMIKQFDAYFKDLQNFLSL